MNKLKIVNLLLWFIYFILVEYLILIRFAVLTGISVGVTSCSVVKKTLALV